MCFGKWTFCSHREVVGFVGLVGLSDCWHMLPLPCLNSVGHNLNTDMLGYYQIVADMLPFSAVNAAD